MTKETRESVVFWTALISTLLSVGLFFALISTEAYIRWTLNKDFTMLGGFTSSTLGLLALGQVAALIFAHRSGR